MGKTDVAFESSAPWLCAPALGPDGSQDLCLLLGHCIDSVRGAHEVMSVPYGTDASTIVIAALGITAPLESCTVP